MPALLAGIFEERLWLLGAFRNLEQRHGAGAEITPQAAWSVWIQKTFSCSFLPCYASTLHRKAYGVVRRGQGIPV